MKPKIIVCLALILSGLLSAVYLGWILHRSRMFIADKLWPRPWPFPDKLIEHWERWLDAAHPTPPGFIKVDGEWERLHFYLYCWIGLSIMVTMCGIVWIGVLRHKERLN